MTIRDDAEMLRNRHPATNLAIAMLDPNTPAVRLVSGRDFGSFIRAELAGPPDLVAHLPRTAFAAIAQGPIRVRLLPDSLAILPGDASS